MDSAHEDGFVVFIRKDRGTGGPPETMEFELRHCSTFEEARRVRREQQLGPSVCVIRFVGAAGGGD
jgi:hypothetical protein